MVLMVAVVAFAIALGGDLGSVRGAVLGGDTEVGWGVFRLAHAWSAVAGGLWETAWLAPTGARLWPGIEALVMGPVVGVLGPVAAWNLLVVIRALAAGLGMSLLFADRSETVRVSAAAMVTVAAVHIAALPDLGAMVWVPMGMSLVRRGGGWPVLGGLVLSTTAGFFGALALGLATGGAWNRRDVLTAAAVSGLGVVLEAWTVAGEFPTLGASVQGLSPPAVIGAGSLSGAVGIGPLAWGSPVWVLAVVGALAAGGSEQARRGAWLSVFAAVLALGPVLRPWQEPLSNGGRFFPLPGAFIGMFPPLSACSHWAGMGFLVSLGAAVALSALVERNRVWALAVPLAVVGLGLGVTRVPDLADDVLGETLVWPPRAGAAGLLGALAGGRVACGPESPLPPTIAALVQHVPFSLPTLQLALKAAGITTLAIDGDAMDGSPAEMIWLTGGNALARVDGPPWPDVNLEPLDSPASQNVAPLPTDPRAFGGWAVRDPDLEPFFDLSMLPDAMVQVSVWTSVDSVHWDRKGVIAHSLGSLGLTVVRAGERDEALVLSATPSKTLAVSQGMRHLHSSSVMALTTSDGDNWGARQWYLSTPLAVIDPQVDWRDDAGGFSVVAWVRTGSMSQDPVHLSGGHPVFTGAESARAGWFDVPPPVYTLPHLADPMMVDDLLFATVFPSAAPPSIRVARRGEHGYSDIADLVGLTVPFAWRSPDGVELLAHSFSPAGVQEVVRLHSADGVTWSPPVVYAGVGPRCESPVQAHFQGKEWLFCSERLKDPAG